LLGQGRQWRPMASPIEKQSMEIKKSNHGGSCPGLPYRTNCHPGYPYCWSMDAGGFSKLKRIETGVIGIIGGFQGGGVGSFILGVVNVLVGLLLLGSPVAAALAVPLVFGVLLVVQGVASIVLAFRVRA